MKIWPTAQSGTTTISIIFRNRRKFHILFIEKLYRFGFGRFTTEEEVEYTAQKCIRHVQRLREMSPLWEMSQEGIDIKSIQWTQH